MTCCLLQSKNKQLNQTPSLVQKGKRRRFCVEKQKQKTVLKSRFVKLSGICVTKIPNESGETNA